MRTRYARQYCAMLVLLLPLALTACSSADGEPGPPAGSDRKAGDHKGSAAGTAELSLPEETFSFTLAFCMIDDTDAIAHGPGEGKQSGDDAYLAIDFVREANVTTGGASIDLGTDQHMKSMDDQISFNFDVTDDSMSFIGASFALEGDFRRTGVDGVSPGTLSVDCR